MAQAGVWPDCVDLTVVPAHTNATANDDGANWCVGTERYNGDRGSPNRANPTCP